MATGYSVSFHLNSSSQTHSPPLLLLAIFNLLKAPALLFQAYLSTIFSPDTVLYLQLRQSVQGLQLPSITRDCREVPKGLSACSFPATQLWDSRSKSSIFFHLKGWILTQPSRCLNSEWQKERRHQGWQSKLLLELHTQQELSCQTGPHLKMTKEHPCCEIRVREFSPTCKWQLSSWSSNFHDQVHAA